MLYFSEKSFDLLKEIQSQCWVYVNVRHLDGKTAGKIFDNPELMPQYVPENYCGEFFDEDVATDLPDNASEEERRIYEAGYLSGYHRGIDRVRPPEN